MGANSKLKFKLLYIMKILMDKTDENHAMTVNEIIAELEKYDIKAERKSIYSDIDLLSDFGLMLFVKRVELTNTLLAQEILNCLN